MKTHALRLSRTKNLHFAIAPFPRFSASEKLKERANVLAKIKEDIKLFGFKTSDFKGVLATRKKRGTATKKVAAKKTTK